ncbi:hypothetical protein CspeluHIS016_0308730 [Cutaneotrichosporon spelunceum]|uniref:Ser-Thr-rich glycosyl-phosphatidyl-inositol-anchored membrane family-domain-containing protein n=1 Tax=Cutaneotrichosporon spelunceum TaxID=1672016 RepID=A0AAD3TUW1_9TREE|nr:hypothetical protein CspeluHIS016_0308730 [Cutaneotrichosporon spelunceum]
MYTALLAALTLVTGAAAEITILYPYAGATWFMNDSVPFNWTVGNPATDAKEFRVLLSGGGMATPQEIAQEVPASSLEYRVLLPQINAGDGFSISFVNTTNEGQVFAKSNAFKIEPGVTPTTTSSIAIPSATSAINNIPNASVAPTSANPFASASAKAGGAAQMAAPVVAAGAIAAAIIAAI